MLPACRAFSSGTGEDVDAEAGSPAMGAETPSRTPGRGALLSAGIALAEYMSWSVGMLLRPSMSSSKSEGKRVWATLRMTALAASVGYCSLPCAVTGADATGSALLSRLICGWGQTGGRLLNGGHGAAAAVFGSLSRSWSCRRHSNLQRSSLWLLTSCWTLTPPTRQHWVGI
ncbi:hypothetical protein BD413DRAFT_146223 [Trametes elegans]|nr:hypothetical protein BD413DRAFT_146223 [Trametes elegans]